MAELARAQESCQEMQDYVLISGHKILRNNSLGVPKPLVSVSMQCLLLNSVHSLAHLGISATRRMLTSRFTCQDPATGEGSC